MLGLACFAVLILCLLAIPDGCGEAVRGLPIP